MHGSALSLISTGSSSLYSGMGTEDKHSHEVRRLRRDLSDAQDKVHTLTSQLSTNVSIKININKIVCKCKLFCSYVLSNKSMKK